MLTIKLTDEQVKRFGAKTADEFIALLEAAHNPKEPMIDEARIKALEDANAALRAQVDAQAKTITDLAASVAKIEPSTILKDAATEARTIAAKEVSSAIARAGTNGLGGGSEKPETDASAKDRPAPGDYEAQWKADSNLRAEFGNFKTFEAFMKATENGQVVMLNSKPKN